MKKVQFVIRVIAALLMVWGIFHEAGPVTALFAFLCLVVIEAQVVLNRDQDSINNNMGEFAKLTMRKLK